MLGADVPADDFETKFETADMKILKPNIAKCIEVVVIPESI